MARDAKSQSSGLDRGVKGETPVIPSVLVLLHSPFCGHWEREKPGAAPEDQRYTEALLGHRKGHIDRDPGSLWYLW